jgi:electron transport protein HydN
MWGMNRFVIAEPDKCIGCRTCEIACVLAHPVEGYSGQELPPEYFRPRLKLVKTRTLTVPVKCRQCENAPCVNVCPTEALFYERGIVNLQVKNCIGCQSCVIACPFGAIEIIEMPIRQQNLGPLNVKSAVSVAHKCDVCIDVPEGPACVRVCPTKAVFLIDSDDIRKRIEKNRTRMAATVPTGTQK